jgi:hypothetical protein
MESNYQDYVQFISDYNDYKIGDTAEYLSLHSRYFHLLDNGLDTLNNLYYKSISDFEKLCFSK